MFCKICFDSGNSSFNTHYVRDAAKNIICPVLLNAKCMNCGYYGHTSKYCKNISLSASIQKTNKETIKSVKFGKDVKSYSACQSHTNKFDFCLLAIEDVSHDDFEVDFDNIILGVGLRDMIGVSWADVCD